MKWGEIYRSREKVSERGHKPGFYVVVSRDFIAGHDDITTVICAPIYGEVLGFEARSAAASRTRFRGRAPSDATFSR